MMKRDHGRSFSPLPLLSLGIVLSIAAPALDALGSDLPAGPGRERVEQLCQSCHTTRQLLLSSGYTRDDWDRLTATMLDLSASPRVKREVLDYLATYLPPDNPRPATLVPGPVEIEFESWQVPTLGQRSRDPVEGAEGRIWWVGQGMDIVGVIDPDTGTMTEYRLPAGARPHSVTPGPDGALWVMGNRNATLIRVAADTGAMTVIPTDAVDPMARDPHTGEFDARGRLWFTMQQSNRIGRFDPDSGAMHIVEMPRPHSRPYGIRIAADGTPWVACNGSNCLVSVDPESMATTVHELPDDDTHVRRLDIAADGTIWYVNSGRGRLGNYDPRTGRITEWPTPSGSASHPYALAVVDGIVWFNESGVRPDPLVRFDPATESFQSWPIGSSGVYGGILRHMRADRDGNLLIHQSGTNHIMRVRVAGP